MATTIGTRLKNAWNTFVNQEEERQRDAPQIWTGGMSSYGARPDRVRTYSSGERTISASIYTRIAIDFASNDIRHVYLDENQRLKHYAKSALDNCLSLEANIDQDARAFKQDMIMTLFDKGCIAVVAVDTTSSPVESNSYDVLSMRVGEVVAWYPRHVTVNLYNDRNGKREEVTLTKESVAIIENPLYSVMNEPNSTLQRLIRKLNLLDMVDDQASSGKLDLIIQLPYAIKSEGRREQADKRRVDIEMQLKGSKYGIAYVDATEKITQLNRPAENNLLVQIESLTKKLYGELGITEEVINGTADEKTMLNYYTRTIEPLLESVTSNFKRTFLTRTARTQGQSIEHFRDPFKLVPINSIAEIADKFTRNEILTSNEVRDIIGRRPSEDPKANQLLNKNIPAADTVPPTDRGGLPGSESG